MRNLELVKLLEENTCDSGLSTEFLDRILTAQSVKENTQNKELRLWDNKEEVAKHCLMKICT
jgi:hypothetical protein